MPSKSGVSLGAIATLVGALALAGAGGAYLWISRLGSRPVVVQVGENEVTIPAVAPAAPKIPRVIYLERRGAVLTAGDDDAHQNVSSVLRHYGKAEVKIPAFAGSDKRWKAITDCVKKQFAPFDVEVTDVRPTAPGYVMAVFGGKPSLVGADRKVAGLAPYNGDVIPDAVVMIFSHALGDDARIVCETAAMEIAHAYGLDHEYTCRDPMGYLDGCGARWFRDQAFRCGEHKARDCKDGSPTQNSVAKLGAVLGFRDGGGGGAARTAGAPPGKPSQPAASSAKTD
jgi:hypothetical protein